MSHFALSVMTQGEEKSFVCNYQPNGIVGRKGEGERLVGSAVPDQPDAP